MPARACFRALLLLVAAFQSEAMVNPYSDFVDINSVGDSSQEEAQPPFLDTKSDWDAHRGAKQTIVHSGDNSEATHRVKRSLFDAYSNWDVPLTEKRTFLESNRDWVNTEKRSLIPGQWDTEKRYWDTEASWPRGKRYRWRRPSYTTDFWSTENSWPRGKRADFWTTEMAWPRGKRADFWTSQMNWPRGKRAMSLDGPSEERSVRDKRYITPKCRRCLFQSSDWTRCSGCYGIDSVVPYYDYDKRSASVEVEGLGKHLPYDIEDGNGLCGCCKLNHFNYMCCLQCSQTRRK